ncbi:MAG: YgjP-like metallopeptidase domain-containing protein [Deltaproteobacteria bacterium]
MKKGDLFHDLPANVPSEIFETLAKNKEILFERIVSLGHSTKKGEWLSQERDEWVMLLQGAAVISFEDKGDVKLAPGEYLLIPAGQKHRVEWTEPAGHTVWLALHFPADHQEKETVKGIARVKVIRSSRRRKTAGARLFGGTMYVTVPKSMPEAELKQIVDRFSRRFNKVLLKNELNSTKSLRQVAEELNSRYFGGSLKIDSIQYVTDQTSKFGCCNCETRAIRISHTIAAMPGWVRDYVVMHEICHLKVPSHDKAFWDLVRRYPLAERAKGFLMAKGLEADEE